MKAGEKAVSAALRLGTFLSFFCVACSAVLVLGRMEYVMPVLVIALAFAFYTVGYLLQAGTCRLLRQKRVDDIGTYEPNEKMVRVSLMIPSIIFAAVAFFVGMDLVDKYLLLLSETVDGAYYDAESLVPLFISLGIPPMSVVGSVAWFIPSSRAFSLKFVFVELILTLIFAVIAGFSEGCVLLLAVLAIVALYGVNQTSIARKHLVDAVSTLTLRARLNNVSIGSVFLLLAVLLTLLSITVFTGFTTLVTVLLTLVLSNAQRNEYEDYDQPDLGKTMGETIKNNTGIESGWTIALSVLCFIVFFTALLLLALRRLKTISDFLKKVGTFIVRLIQTVLLFISFDSRKRRIEVFKKEENLTFSDSEQRIQNAVINTYGSSAQKINTYKDFLSKLKKLGSQDERLMFAYVTMISVMKKRYPFIRQSDTPREIGLKLKTNSNITDIGEITAAFETAAYAMSAEREYETATKAICRVLMANMA